MLAAAQIIDAVAARITGLPLTGSRVHTSRAWPLGEDDLPAWRVIAGDEDIEPVLVHRPPRNRHQLSIELHGYAQAVADLDAALHALAEQSIAAIFAEPQPDDDLAAISSLAQLTLQRITRTLAAEGEATLGSVVVTLQAVFHARSSAPGTII